LKATNIWAFSFDVESSQHKLSPIGRNDEMRYLVTILAALMVSSISLGQQAHSSLSEQKVCADQAKKFFMGTEYSDDSKHPIKNEFTSHYDASKKICYVRIDYNTRADPKETMITSYVFDAFEGRNVASYNWISQTGKKYWEVKPIECSVKPAGGEKIYCKTTQEFEDAVEKYFGLGE
jgi:hypothetical protein